MGLFVVACTQSDALVSQEQSSQIKITKLVVNADTLPSGITGRAISVSNDKIASDIFTALSRRIRAQGLSGDVSATLIVNLTKVALVSPGQTWMVGGKSQIHGVISIKSSGGQTILAPQSIKGFSDTLRAGGLIGAITAPSAGLDYKQTVEGFANEAVQKIFQGGTLALDGDLIN